MDVEKPSGQREGQRLEAAVCLMSAGTCEEPGMAGGAVAGKDLGTEQ